MSIPNRHLRQFFEQFNFERYTYNPSTDPRAEFNRLCEARQWGASKIRQRQTEFSIAIQAEQGLGQSSAGPEVIKFFRKYEYQLFAYDLHAPAQSEFQRLVGLRKWGQANLSKVKKQFNKALTLDSAAHSASEPTALGHSDTPEVDLLADWLRKQECPRYRYLGDLPELEFKKLVSVRRSEWIQEDRLRNSRRLGMSMVGRGPWKGSPEFKLLRKEFYGVVEEVFNSLLDELCQITGLKRWQVLVGLYGEGKIKVGIHEAKTILKKVFINIFDFLDVFKEILKNPPTTDGKKLLRILKPFAIELQFPSNLMLGVYSALTNRVFPIEVVDKKGTLVLLLHHIKTYLEKFEYIMEKFEEEAGDELAEAEEEGRVGVRRLLLSREWACLGSLSSLEPFSFL
ncbi:hypothetical protein L873DRAFT_1815275 [Choiromyces venosus 120613-1]|uniref:Uncharacterized protein n=1 Tax=Choiromyces venosus 120613-1 TaxID=1336337 RepID=A0A3N4J6W7_9PEZI|nr:hypothetical protein L873DRAFT_1815275 [Choiromyces venosus 120613-1]